MIIAAPQCGQTKVGWPLATVGSAGCGSTAAGRTRAAVRARGRDARGVRHWRAARSGECGGSRRQNVQQEAAHELVGTERHRLVARLPRGAVILPAEGDAAFIEREQPLVRDRHPVGVAGQIGEHRSRAGERALGIDDPFALGAVARARAANARASASPAYSPKNCSRPSR